MAALIRVVVEWPVKIGGDYAHKISSILFIVQTTFNLAHAFCVSIAFV